MKAYLRFLWRCVRLSFHGDWKYYLWMFTLTAIALVGLAAGAHALLCLLRGRSFVDALVRLPFWRIVLALFVLLWAAWGYKYLVWEDATAR